MRRVLIVAYYFPPIGGIGSIRLAAFASHLPEFGWEPTVLAPRATPHAHDDALALPRGARDPLAFARAEPSGRALRSGRRRRLATRRGRRAVAWAPGAFSTPTRRWAGTRAPPRPVCGPCAAGSFDAVYSSSFPITAHLVARTLARRARLPWVAEFRDPWSDGLPPDHPHRRRARALEDRIAKEAALTIVPTPTWAGYLGDRWRKPVAVVPNGHDGREASPARPPEGPVLSHLGTFYPRRQSLEALWGALAELRRTGSSPPRVRFVGELPGAVMEQATAAGVADLVEVTGFVPHGRAVELIAESSMLFASGGVGTGPVDRGWVPAKLFEYLASDRPILYLGDPEGDAGALLHAQPGCHVVRHDDVDGVLTALRDGLSGTRYDRDVSGHSRRARTEALAMALNEAVLRR